MRSEKGHPPQGCLWDLAIPTCLPSRHRTAARAPGGRPPPWLDQGVWPGRVARVTERRFGAASAGSSGRGGSSLLSTRRRSRITSRNKPVRPCRCLLKPLLSAASHFGRVAATRASVKFRRTLADSQGFRPISRDETLRAESRL